MRNFVLLFLICVNANKFPWNFGRTYKNLQDYEILINVQEIDLQEDIYIYI